MKVQKILVYFTLVGVVTCVAWVAGLSEVRASEADAAFDADALHTLNSQIESLRDQDPSKAKHYFGDTTLIRKAEGLLRVGTPKAKRSAGILQMHYVDLLERSGVIAHNLTNRAFVLSGERRWAVLRFYADVEPKKIRSFAFQSLMGTAMLLEREVPSPTGKGVEAKTSISDTLSALANWANENPSGAADYIYESRVFQLLVLDAIEDLMKNDGDTAFALSIDLRALALGFMAAPKSSPKMHRFPKVMTQLAAHDSAGDLKEDVARLEHEATLDAVNRTAMTIAIAGSVVATGGGSLAVIGPAMALSGFAVSGGLSAKDAFDRAESGDDKKFYSWTMLGDVFFAASVFAAPIARGVSAIKVAESTPLSESVSAQLTRAAELGSKSAHSLQVTERLLTAGQKLSAVGYASYNMIYQSYRLLHLKKIAQREGRSTWDVAAECAAYMVLRSGFAYLAYRDWSAQPEVDKKREVAEVR